MRRKTRIRVFAAAIAGTFAGCAGSTPTSAPAEKQDPAARSAGPRAPEVAIDAGQVLLDGPEVVKIADLPPAAETIGPLFDALA